LVFPKEKPAQGAYPASDAPGVFQENSARHSLLEKVRSRKIGPNLSYDCLDVQAVDALQSYLSTPFFFKTITEELAAKCHKSSKAVELNAEENKDWNAKKVENLLTRGNENLDTIKGNTKRILEASRDLAESNILLLQKEYRVISKLVGYDQPRLTFAFLEAEKNAMSGLTVLNCRDIDAIKDSMKHMIDSELVFGSEVEKFKKELDNVQTQVNQLAVSQGYRDYKQMEETWWSSLQTVSAIATVAGGATAVVTYFGMSTVAAEMTSLAFAGLTGGVGVLLVGAVFGLVTIRNCAWYKEKSEKLVKTQILALQAIGEAVKAQENHSTKLTRLRKELDRRCVW